MPHFIKIGKSKKLYFFDCTKLQDSKLFIIRESSLLIIF
jgi:hypothetical protein